jgi:hypothetical protein
VLVAGQLERAGQVHGLIGEIQLRDASATAAAVRQVLEQSPPLAHFACHGTQDVTNPSAGNLRNLRPGAPWLWASYVHIGP